jgi:O-antigen/teichoic acid export membrane protein
VLTLISGTAGAQVITVAFIPFIARIYGPEAFGGFGSFSAILNILIPVAALTYPIAIALPRFQKDVVAVIWVCLISGLFVALISSIIFFLFNHNILPSIIDSSVLEYYYLFPIAVLFATLQQTTEQWMIRSKEYKAIAKASVTLSLMLNGSKLSAGLLVPFASTLIYIQTFSLAFNALLLFMYAKGKSGFWAIKKPDFLKIYATFKKYKDFPIYRSPQVVLFAISESLPVLFLGHYFGPAVAGFYVLSRGVMGVPLLLVGKTLGDVFYQKISKSVNDGGDYRREIEKTTLYLTLIAAPVFLCIFFSAEFIFKLVFGEVWLMSGTFAAWLSFWFFSSLIARPVIVAIPALGYQRQFLIFELFALILRAAVIFIGVDYFSNAVVAISIFSFANFFLYIALIVTLVAHAKKHL